MAMSLACRQSRDIPTITSFTPAAGVVDPSVAATGSTRPP